MGVLAESYAEHAVFVRVDVDKARAMAEEHSVMDASKFVLFKEGKKVIKN